MDKDSDHPHLGLPDISAQSPGECAGGPGTAGGTCSVIAEKSLPAVVPKRIRSLDTPSASCVIFAASRAVLSKEADGRGCKTKHFMV